VLARHAATAATAATFPPLNSFPACRFYWVDYTSYNYPVFATVDGTLDSFKYTRYSHWGTYFEGGKAIPEPRNQAESQTCAGANFTQTYGSPAAWGWGTAPCRLMRPFMCRNVSEWPQWHSLPFWLPAASVGTDQVSLGYGLPCGGSCTC
jgi:hypothetical protein